MNKKIAIKDVTPNMKFKATDPKDLNFYGVFKYGVQNQIQNPTFKAGDIFTTVETIDNNQIHFTTDNGDHYVAYWSVFRNETVPMFDTSKILAKNTVAYYLSQHELTKLPFEVVKKEFNIKPSNTIEYPVVLGVRYEYGLDSNFNLDVIKAYKSDENIQLFEDIVLNKISNNWKDIQPRTTNKENTTKIKLFTRRKKVIMEIAKLPHELDEAIVEIKQLIQLYKNDSKTHIAVK